MKTKCFKMCVSGAFRGSTGGLVAVALGFVLAIGLPASPAGAHCKGKHEAPHEHCGGGEPPVIELGQELLTIQRHKNNAKQIVMMNADGTDAQVLLRMKNTSLNHVSWSGDGSKVLFTAEINQQRGTYWMQVFELDGDGKRLKFAPGEPNFVHGLTQPFIRWSPTTAPGGREWIVYWDADPLTGVSQIWLVDPYWPNQKKMLTEGTLRNKNYPTWSPQADRIGFLSGPVGGPELPGDVEILYLSFDSVTGIPELDTNAPNQGRVSLIVNNDAAEEIKVRLEETRFIRTDWANDAEWIATMEAEPLQIWVFPTDPAEVAAKAKNLTNDPELSYFSPVWSPRDDALMLSRERHGGVCDVPDTSEPGPTQGLASTVIVPLTYNPPDATDEIEELVICDATSPLDWLGHRYDWWRGGVGVPPPPGP